jgi:ATP-dependent Lon protease
VDPALVRKMLGPERFMREELTRTKAPGVVMGLAYTPVGGEVLFIEATAFPGKGVVTLTGQIGEVMKESASAALSLFKTRAPGFHYDAAQLAQRDMHIHVPAGAVPKDGPSAGVAMYTAIASLLLDIPVQPALAMTGEITLRGRVLPVGGIKEKSLAASRIGIKTIIMPKQNERDLEEVHPIVREKVKFVFAQSVDDVLEHAFGRARLEAAIKSNERTRKSETQDGRQPPQHRRNDRAKTTTAPLHTAKPRTR